MASPAPPRIVTTEHDVDDDATAHSSNSAHSSPSRDHLHVAPHGGPGIIIPPSPTLTSTSSNIKFDESPSSPHALTSLALRDNDNTNAKSDHLKVIGEGHPGDAPRHRRLSSVGTWSTVEFDDAGNRVSAWPPLPDAEKPEAAGYWEKRAEKKRVKGEEKEERKRLKEEAKHVSAHIDPDSDTTDPTPFKEKPSRLAMLVDPKSLDDLERIGGINGLLQGLGVDSTKGLTMGLDAGARETGAPRAGADMPSGNGAQWTASIEKRREIYGKNDLPARNSKSIFYLMWLALKDKVLVSRAHSESCPC